MEQLRTRYPEVYGELHEADCGDGWFAILDALGEALSYHAEMDNRSPPQVLSCKQKCGRLVFGKLHLPLKERSTFEIATAMSLRICERCGGPLDTAQVHAPCVCSSRASQEPPSIIATHRLSNTIERQLEEKRTGSPMSFVPHFVEHLISHLQLEERRRMLAALATTTAPEHWLSLEAAALLDVERERFGLAERLDERPNVPRWLVAAERKKVDLWVEDLRGVLPPVSIEFKVVHNNKNAYQKIWEIRRDIAKTIPNTESNDSVERWAIAMLVYSKFYGDQSGNYSYGDFADREAFLEAFSKGVSDSDSWYQDAPLLKSEIGPVQICSLDAANFVEPGQGAAIYLALMKRK
jgi:hypothetical protein